VINWTLSSQTTRLLLKIGVPSGTDIARAQGVMLEAVRGTPDVLREPAPAVFFAGFGASSLDFEIHAFVDAFDKRTRVQHEINLAVDRAREHGIKIKPCSDLHFSGAPTRDKYKSCSPTPSDCTRCVDDDSLRRA
jgi:potassium efflux system protein